MNCQRASEVDLAELLRGSGGAADHEFRDHYARCPDCAAEVDTWTTMHGILASPGSPHPPAKKLLWFGERPQSLPADEREAIEQHVGACRSCRDELTTLRGLDLHSFTRPLAGIETTVPVTVAGADGAARRATWLRPRLAFAVVALGLVPLFMARLEPPVPSAIPTAVAPPPAPATPAEKAARAVGATSDGAGAGRSKGTQQPPAKTAPHPSLSAGKAEFDRAPNTEPSAPTTAPPVGGQGLAAPNASAAAPSTTGPTIRLRPAGSTRVPASAQTMVLLIAPSHTAAATTTTADIRIVDATQRRELRQVGTVDGDTVSTRVTGEWLTPGDYQVEVNVAGVLAVYRLTITR